MLISCCLIFVLLRCSYGFGFAWCSHGRSCTRSSSMVMSSTLEQDNGDKQGQQQQQTGKVYVCTNRWCREKGSEATMATFSFLCPDSVPIVGINCLGRCNKGPNARILTRNNEYIDASMVRSVDTVVSLLKTHLFLEFLNLCLLLVHWRVSFCGLAATLRHVLECLT